MVEIDKFQHVIDMDLTLISAIAGVAGGLWKCFSLVSQGQVALQTRMGKVVRDKKSGEVRVYNPGMRIIVPFFWSMKNVHVRKNSLELKNLQATLKDGLLYRYNAYLMYELSVEPKHLEICIFQVGNITEAITLKAESVVRELLSGMDLKEASGENLHKQLVDSLSAFFIENFGVHLVDAGISSIGPAEAAQKVSVVQALYDLAKSLGVLYQPGVLAGIFGSAPVTAFSGENGKSEGSQDYGSDPRNAGGLVGTIKTLLGADVEKH